jgi:hypothetical protein
MPQHPVLAFSVLLGLLLVPAVGLLVYGARAWHKGQLQQHEDSLRLGRMLVMFGIILLSILVVVSYFLTGKLPGA